jgi:NitT/TauT family transport system ATP-binding protein
MPGVHVQAHDVSKTYVSQRGEPVHALDHVSLETAPGEFVAVLGPSGCGKSTMLMLVAGLIAPTSGTIRVAGEPLLRPRADASIVFQRDVLLDWRSVLDNVLLPVEIKRMERGRYRARADDLLKRVGLAGFDSKYPRELSGGMRQRVAICRALIQEPRLLLMDEPFGALDALTREQMGLDLHRIWSASRNSVVFVTHSIEEAVFLSDRVVVMSPRPGRIVETLPVALARPRGAHTRAEPGFATLVEHIRDVFRAQRVLSS